MATGSIWCLIITTLGYPSAECTMPAAMPAVEERESDTKALHAVPPPKVEAPAPVVTPQPTAAPPAVGKALITGGPISLSVGDAKIGLPVRIDGTMVEVTATAGSGVSIQTGKGMADAGVAVIVDAADFPYVGVVAESPGQWTVQVRALGPGGWSPPVAVSVRVAAPPVAEASRQPQERVVSRKEAMERVLRLLGDDSIIQRGPGVAGLDDPLENGGVVKERDYLGAGLKSDNSTGPVDRSRIITADRYITGVLEHRVNSQVPGRLVISLDRPVYAAEGFLIGLEAGTKVICTYKPLEKQGNTRLPVGCERAIRPDGSTIVLHDMVTGDAMASAGLPGDVDNRVWERYGAAMIAASVSAVASVGKSAVENPFLNNATQSYTDALGKATATILERTIDLAPIITIPAGTIVVLQPMRDIYMANPRG